MRQLNNHHWLRLWLVAWTAPCHYPDRCWNVVNWTTGNKLQWNLNPNWYISFKKMPLKMSGKWRAFCLGLNLLKHVHFEICLSIRSSLHVIDTGSFPVSRIDFHGSLVPQLWLIGLRAYRDRRMNPADMKVLNMGSNVSQVPIKVGNKSPQWTYVYFTSWIRDPVSKEWDDGTFTRSLSSS